MKIGKIWEIEPMKQQMTIIIDTEIDLKYWKKENESLLKVQIDTLLDDLFFEISKGHDSNFTINDIDIEYGDKRK